MIPQLPTATEKCRSISLRTLYRRHRPRRSILEKILKIIGGAVLGLAIGWVIVELCRGMTPQQLLDRADAIAQRIERAATR